MSLTNFLKTIQVGLDAKEIKISENGKELQIQDWNEFQSLPELKLIKIKTGNWTRFVASMRRYGFELIGTRSENASRTTVVFRNENWNGNLESLDHGNGNGNGQRASASFSVSPRERSPRERSPSAVSGIRTPRTRGALRGLSISISRSPISRRVASPEISPLTPFSPISQVALPYSVPQRAMVPASAVNRLIDFERRVLDFEREVAVISRS